MALGVLIRRLIRNPQLATVHLPALLIQAASLKLEVANVKSRWEVARLPGTGRAGNSLLDEQCPIVLVRCR
jgi:hypothetical protein